MYTNFLKKNVIVVMFFIITSMLFANYSDGFLIGAYSHYKRNAPLVGMSQSEMAEDIAQYMHNANFNAVMSAEDPSIFYNHQVDPITRSGRMPYYTSYTNVYYEAEFLTDQRPNVTLPDDWCPEMKWYQMKPELNLNIVNNVTNIEGIDSENYIYCNEANTTEPGYMVNGYINPWKEDDVHNYSKSQLTHYGSHYILKFRMKINSDDYISEDEEVCRIGAKLLYKNDQGTDTSTDDEYQYFEIPLDSDGVSYLDVFSDDPNTYEIEDNMIVIDKADFINQYNMGHDAADFVEFEFKLNLPHEPTSSHDESLLYDWQIHESDWKIYQGAYATINLCPTVYYSRNGELAVDNVGITDDMFVQLNNGDFDDNIASIVNNNLQYSSLFDGRDEPKPAQFASHRLVQDKMWDISSDIKLFQSTNFRNYYDALKDTGTLDNDFIDSRIYLQLGNAKQVLTQQYPLNIYRQVNITSDDDTNYNQITDRLQSIFTTMCSNYGKERKACNDNESEYYPVIQSYGSIRMYTDSAEDGWRTLLPPNKMQQVLSYLPLCYGVDGILYYKIDNMNTKYNLVSRDETDFLEDVQHEYPYQPNDGNGYYQRALVNKMSASEDWEIAPQYNVVKEANQEIQNIGIFLKTITWDENKTFTIMPEESISYNLTDQIANNVSIHANDPTGIANGYDPNGIYYEGYEGFVECSIYNDGVTDYFMLVNRRANFAKEEYLNLNGNEGEARFRSNILDILDTNELFVEADPQEVVFTFNDGSDLPDNYKFIDFYTGDIFDPNIPLEMQPGEAKLLKLSSSTVPEIITSDMDLTGALVFHNINITPNNTLTLNGTNTFKGESEIVIEEGATLHVVGNTRLGKYVSIINNGLLIVDGSIKGENGEFNGIVNNSTGSMIISGSIIVNAVGENNPLIYNKSTLSINEGNLRLNSDPGILILNEGDLTVSDNSILKGDNVIKTIYGSHVNISSSSLEGRFVIWAETGSDINIVSSTLLVNKPYGKCLSLLPISDCIIVNISGTQDSPTIFKATTNAEYAGGIYIHRDVENSIPINCSNAEFDGFWSGIQIKDDVKNNDNITDCTFKNCEYGFLISGLGSCKPLEHLRFENNDTGIYINTFKTTIRNCLF